MTEKEIQGTFTPIKINEEREIIKADPKYIKWEQDPVGYFLIKVDKKDKVIRVGFCTNDNKLTKEFIGKTAEELYHTIIAKQLVTVLAHAANLGRELEKAELVMEPKSTVRIDDEKSEQAVRLLELLDDYDDTENVWSNLE